MIRPSGLDFKDGQILIVCKALFPFGNGELHWCWMTLIFIKTHSVRTLNFDLQYSKSTARNCSAPGEKLKELYDFLRLFFIFLWQQIVMMFILNVSIRCFIRKSSPAKCLRHFILYIYIVC